ncbi:uncharacterized protein LOC111702337 [Eurytemora carolleeae]|uniref:uncharacterized protein LOC111702337 n=1 Tax=Eurytemora carolleeae TaxID=1294199 RepID=UPI000C766C5E|nr:uncharacterized protein LOC111702337 [Eurytemora carolleeae]|eukprot:XP_023329756.1 uncharacterized protein LOC111702337 [Eurytemora affinis]
MNLFLLVLGQVCVLAVAAQNNKTENKEDLSKKITNLLAPENEEFLKSEVADKTKNRFFRSKPASTPEEKVAKQIWHGIRKLPCKKDCGTFSEHYQESLSKVVELFSTIETNEEIDQDDSTLFSIYKEVTELYLDDENTNKELVKSGFLKAIKNSKNPDLKNVHIDPADIIQSLRTENMKKGTGFRAGAGETPWDQLKKFPTRVQAPDDKLDYFREDQNLHVFHTTFHNNYQDFETRKHEHFFYFHRLLTYRYFNERDTEGLDAVVPLNKENRKQEFSSFYSITPENDPSNNLGQFTSNKPTCTLSAESNGILEKSENECDSQVGSGNIEVYGNACAQYHNDGHNHISADCVDGSPPSFGVIYSSGASARDTVFFKWHFEVDNKYENFLRAQRPYTREEISPPQGLILTNVELRSRCSSPNQVETYWEIKDSRYQLNHMKYSLRISLQNANGLSDKVIVRVYLVKEKFVADHKYFFELDRFTHKLSGEREETIDKEDKDSSLVWRQQDECGWASSLVLPKGMNQKPEKYRLIVFMNDLQDQSVTEGENDEPTILCGSKSNMDPRANGFPVERSWQGVNKQDIIDNKDSGFGKISSVVEILNRGLNPTSCDDAEFSKDMASTSSPPSSSPSSGDLRGAPHALNLTNETTTAAVTELTSSLESTTSSISTTAGDSSSNTSDSTSETTHSTLSSMTSLTSLETTPLTTTIDEIDVTTANGLSGVSTESSIVTTETSDVTTKSSVVTTSLFDTTTSSSDVTTEALDATTEALDVTTSLSDVTFGSSETTTESSDVTTSSLDLTSSSSELTTSALDLTSSSSALDVTTSALDVTTSALDVTTSALDVTTSALDVTTSVSSSVISFETSSLQPTEATSTAQSSVESQTEQSSSTSSAIEPSSVSSEPAHSTESTSANSESTYSALVTTPGYNFELTTHPLSLFTDLDFSSKDNQTPHPYPASTTTFEPFYLIINRTKESIPVTTTEQSYYSTTSPKTDSSGSELVEICLENVCYKASKTDLDDVISADKLCKKSNMDLIKENDDKILTELVKKARNLIDEKTAWFWTNIRDKISCQILLGGYKENSVATMWTTCNKRDWDKEKYHALCEPKAPEGYSSKPIAPKGYSSEPIAPKGYSK